MSDTRYLEYERRLRRVERSHARGGGFDARGTMGRAAYTSRPRSVNLFRPLLFVIGAGMVLKALLLMHVGDLDYRTRVARLETGTTLEQVGAYVMQPDYATVWLAELFEMVLTAPTQLGG